MRLTSLTTHKLLPDLYEAPLNEEDVDYDGDPLPFVPTVMKCKSCEWEGTQRGPGSSHNTFRCIIRQTQKRENDAVWGNVPPIPDSGEDWGEDPF